MICGVLVERMDETVDDEDGWGEEKGERRMRIRIGGCVIEKTYKRKGSAGSTRWWGCWIARSGCCNDDDEHHITIVPHPLLFEMEYI